MKTKEELAKQLETVEGWLPFYSGWFKQRKAKKLFADYVGGDKKGVADNVILRKVDYGKCHYNVLAFTTEGELDQQAIALLKAAVEQLEVNQIRYEACATGGFHSIVFDDGKYYEDYFTHHAIPELPHVYLHVEAEFESEELDCPYLVYTHVGGALLSYTVNRKYLSFE